MPGNKKILIVDDDEDTRILLAEDVRDLGLEPITAIDGNQAITLARRERPSLIILDYRLPGGNGTTVLERLRQLMDTASIPVIVFSRQPSELVADELLEHGADAYVQKSFANAKLRETILSFVGAPEADGEQAPLRTVAASRVSA